MPIFRHTIPEVELHYMRSQEFVERRIRDVYLNMGHDIMAYVIEAPRTNHRVAVNSFQDEMNRATIFESVVERVPNVVQPVCNQKVLRWRDEFLPASDMLDDYGFHATAQFLRSIKT